MITQTKWATKANILQTCQTMEEEGWQVRQVCDFMQEGQTKFIVIFEREELHRAVTR